MSPRQIASPRGAKAKCDRLFSRIIRARGRCQNCGLSDYGRLQCAHIVSRRFSAVRVDERNAVCLCARCHIFFTDRPVAFGLFVVDMMGEDDYRSLQSRAQAVTRMDWRAEAERLAQRWAEIQAAV